MSDHPCHVSRRRFGATVASLAAASVARTATGQTKSNDFQLRYILGSCMYGYTAVDEILPEVAKVGATAIDIWPKAHGNQREQLDEMGEAVFAARLQASNVSLGCITQYKLGPFRLQDEMRLAERLGCKSMVTGGKGPRGLKGKELKLAVQKFVDQLQPHLEVAEETGVTIAIENHSGNLFEAADGLKWLVDLSDNKHLGVALAPYHLPQDASHLADLIRHLGNRIEIFYAWQHGHGCMKKLPKEEELLQMPGRGALDFGPLLSALKDIEYAGWTEIFMHPVPRGIPILDTTSQVTDEINRARSYLSSQLSDI